MLSLRQRLHDYDVTDNFKGNCSINTTAYGQRLSYSPATLPLPSSETVTLAS